MFFQYFNIFFMIVIITNVSSCASPYIGKTVNRSNSMVCSCSSLPTSCEISDQTLLIKYDIKEINSTNSYTVIGTAEFIGANVWDSYNSVSFRFLLIKENVISDTVSISKGSGSSDNTISFSKKFNTEGEFDAVLIKYCIEVRDEEESNYLRGSLQKRVHTNRIKV